MRGSAKDRRPYVKPVQKIEVSEKNTKFRLILTIVFLVIGALSLGIFVSQIFGKDSGWREIDSGVPGITEEIIFSYDLGASGVAASAEHRLIKSSYSEAAGKIYALFDVYQAYDGLNTLYTLNTHPNEIITVDELLYQALKAITAQGKRYLYAGAAYAEYRAIFTCETDTFAARRDPNKNEDAHMYFAEMMRYANDPAMIDLELLGDGKVCLHVSEEYLSFIASNSIEVLIDFAWLRNAFVVDALAEAMITAGYTMGHLSSSDGFTRNLDARGWIYSYNVFDRFENTIYPAAVWKYEKPMAIVFLRDYPMSTEKDSFRYYSYADGQIATPYLDMSDGCYRSALHNIVAYSANMSCADIALRIAPIYIADVLDLQAIATAARDGVYAIWGEDGVLYYNEPYVSLDSLYSDAVCTYRKEQVSE
jgi:hypothetical protein